MLLKKKLIMSSIAIALAMSNINFINAQNNEISNQNTQIKANSENTIELNKMYTVNLIKNGHTIDIKDFKVPEKGEIVIESTGVIPKPGVVLYPTRSYLSIKNVDTQEEYQVYGLKEDCFKLNLDEGRYRIKILADMIGNTGKTNLDYVIKYKPNKELFDVELNNRYSEVKLNQQIKSDLFEGNDIDRFIFNNDSSRNLTLNLKTTQLEDNKHTFAYQNELDALKILFTIRRVSDDSEILEKSVSYESLLKNGGSVDFNLPRGEYYIDVSLDTSYESYYKMKNIPYQFSLTFQPSQDVKEHWARPQITNFMTSGYIGGYEDGTFKPNNSITRAEFVTILNKYFGLTNKSGKRFDDTHIHWAKEAIDIAVTNGICQGVTSTEFKPDAPLTREQASVMIANYKKISDTNFNKLNNFNDNSNVSSWAKQSVEAMLKAGYMNGYEDNTFKPQEKITRAEAVTTLSRIKK